jgi:hypothetical protein
VKNFLFRDLYAILRVPGYPEPVFEKSFYGAKESIPSLAESIPGLKKRL